MAFDVAPPKVNEEKRAPAGATAAKSAPWGWCHATQSRRRGIAMALRRGVLLAVVAALSAVSASLTLQTDGKLYASGGIGDEDEWEDEDDEPRVFGSFSLQPAADDSHPARGAGDGPAAATQCSRQRRR